LNENDGSNAARGAEQLALMVRRLLWRGAAYCRSSGGGNGSVQNNIALKTASVGV